jgi:hypothetical protein
MVKVIEREAGTELRYNTMPSSSFNIWAFDLDKAIRRKTAQNTRRTKRKRPQA